MKQEPSIFQPGDMPPEGYLAWHEWADVQHKAGIKQVQCCMCCLWQTPQELSGKTHVSYAERIDRKLGRVVRVRIESPICKKCDNGAPMKKPAPVASNEWTCPNCPDNPVFTAETILAHLREVHHITVLRGQRALDLHLNCGDRSVYQFTWTVGGLKFHQSQVIPKRNVNANRAGT